MIMAPIIAALHPGSLLSLLNIAVAVINIVQGQPAQPSFAEEPADTTVVEGGEAILRCVINDMETGTAVLWTKGSTNTPLGFDTDLPGYPRYSVIGDPASEGNLRIIDAQLEDDDTYRCQVPGLRSAEATLTVQVPPDPPTLDNYENGTQITVDPPAAITLTCRTNNGRPEASITWQKNEDPVLYIQPTTSVENSGDPLGKKKNFVSTLTLNPEKEDNGAVYKCVVEHPALVKPHFVSVTVNVRFPPGPPLITGYQQGVAVRQGDLIHLDCASRGGNPLAEVYWWKNGIQMDHSYVTDGASARNTLPIIVGYSDINAVYKCQVSSVVLPEPLTAQVQFTVYFPPAYVNITGHEEMVNSGATITLQCTSANSNPSATISWYSGGQQVSSSPDVVSPAPNGGYITRQNLTVTLTAQTDSMDYMCQATNMELHEYANYVATVSVMYPPQHPVISGYEEGREVKAGNLLRLTCIAVGGNPLATLTWQKNGQDLEGNYGTSGQLATNDLPIILEQTDNKANYSCSASNQATPTPLVTQVSLDVLFPPERVFVTAEPPQSREGDRVVVKCRTASSSPASQLSWWKDGVPVEGGEAVVEPSDNSGFSTSSELVIESVSLSDNGRVFLCRAMNDLIVEAVNDGLIMDVRFKPQISVPDQVTLSTREGPGLQILNCTATGNPETLTYLWHQNGVPIALEGNPHFAVNEAGSLFVHNATRTEVGKYMCVVSNEEGSSNVTMTLDVQYSPIITTGDQIVINLFSISELACEADASPKPQGFISWSRDGFDLSHHQVEYSEGRGILRILNVSKADGGLYTCTANNGIAPAITKNIQVVVQFMPEVDRSVPNKVAQSTGQTAVLRCRAEGAPVVRFKWFQRGLEVNVTSDHYTFDTRQDLTYSNRYESRLYIGPVNEDYDYGSYVCKAYNDLGEATFSVQLEQTSAPEAPFDLEVVTVKHDSVKLRWQPGFDGGRPQTFQVRFNQKGNLQYQYVDVVPPNATSYTITNLNPETDYEFTVRGRNDLGTGTYFLGIVSATTKTAPSQPIPDGPSGILVGNIPLYLFLLVTFLSLLSCVFINIFLVCCLIKRRTSRKRRAAKVSDVKMKKIGSEVSDKESATVTETIDSMSHRDRSEYSKDPYSDDEHSYDDRHYDDRGYGDQRYDDYSDRSYSDHYDDSDRQPITPSRREPGSGYHNAGYRPPSYSASWESFGRSPSVMTDQVSEDQEERDYANQLRRKQAQLATHPPPSTTSSSRPYEFQSSVTPSPVPSSLGNFVTLTKAGKPPASQAGSEEGFLV
ncbi:nephrin-like [Acanthaster planci]|uniref:Nephrin-like n=1 Tax=Acanthaster planci TaxID=133434 RepID=A0A8B7ZY06_ACAPL|nr:nephrin-like [Acanthaster planci]